jgi:hypothetical protein
MTPSELKIIAGWISSLADVTRHPAEQRPTREALGTYATLLSADFPSSAFTSDSLRACATGNDWFPSYDAIRRGVGDWWREHRPAPLVALTDERLQHLDEMDRLWVGYYWRRCQEGCDRKHVLSLVRQQSPAAYREITGDTEAPRTGPTEAEIQRVRETVARGTAMPAGAAASHRVETTTPTWQPKPLHDAALAAIRDASPPVQQAREVQRLQAQEAAP